jgi:hypothetical protein
VNDTKEIEAFRRRIVFWSWTTIVIIPTVVLLLWFFCGSDSQALAVALVCLEAAILLGHRLQGNMTFLLHGRKKED